MSFRARLLLAAVPLALLPVLLLAAGVRREIELRLTRQYDERVEALAAAVADDVARESRTIAERLDAAARALADDNALRLALNNAGMGDRSYLLDYTERAMRLAGLDALQLQDESGRILSSGHFRNDYGRLDGGLPAALRSMPDTLALAELTTPAGPLIALVRFADVRLGGRTLTLLGGTAVDRRFLSNLDRGGGLGIALVGAGGVILPRGSVGDAQRASLDDPQGATPEGSPNATRIDVTVPFVNADGALASASFRVTQSLAPLAQIQRTIDMWFLAATAGAAALALLLALVFAARLSRPLAQLADRTRRLDLDRLDVDFSSRRRDEIGTLSRTLGALTQRLRASVAGLRDAERRATLGDVARQVNHDVRNGLTPIRNVVQHLSQLARERPDQLPAVFLEREPTLDASIGYLHELAASYARLSPRLVRRACDVNAIVCEVVRDTPDAEQSRLSTDLAPGLPAVAGDPVALRRIIENLTRNALESLVDGKGGVVIHTRRAELHGETRVHLSVSDTGAGITPEQQARIFEDFYTTKASGTGLGLSIVRRLVNDMGGALTVDSEPGRGSRFCVDLPAADTPYAAEPVAAPQTRAAAPAHTDGAAR